MKNKECPSFLNKFQMLKLKLQAIRAGIWYRALQRIDRALFDLTLKVDVKFNSKILVSCLLSIKTRLDGFLESKISRAIREIGSPLALKISICGQKLGNVTAVEWAKNSGFIMYLTVMKLDGKTR